MSLKKQKKHKQMSFKRFLNSVKYSIEGLAYAYENEQSLWLHGAGSLFAIIMGFIFDITFIQWAIIVVAFVVVLAIELLNTSIEAVVDLVTSEIHPLAKIAKDCGSAAAFVSGIMAGVICAFIFIPYIIALF